MNKLKGIGVSKGIAIGKVYLYLPHKINVDIDEKDDVPSSVKKEKFEIVKEQSKKEIQSIYERLVSSKASKEAGIFEAQVLFIDDPTINKRVEELIDEGFSLPAAIEKAFKESAAAMEAIENEYFRERAKDIMDVANRLIQHVYGETIPNLSYLPESSVVIAKDLTPSDTASIDRDHIVGFATDLGGVTSHTAILAESFGIPAVVGLKNITEQVRNGEPIIIDGENGEVIIDPDEETIKTYANKIAQIEKEKKELESIKFLEATTRSGKKIEVSANIGSPKDADVAIREGADGVGLFRTEFLFLNKDTAPTEEEQFEAYKTVLEKFGNKPVIIRTLDIGGDKQIPYLHLETELNPFLGVRALRLCLLQTELFKTQLRAILRASVFGNALIMYPMVAVKEEIINANKILEEVKTELKDNNIPFDDNIKVGIMVEIPAAALNAEELVNYVDFFSIGTNDLTQYTFAADRTNENLSYLYQPLSPPVLKLIKMTVDASHKRGKWTGMCGELAGDLDAIPTLIDIGLDELSMSPQKIPYAKKLITNL
jgi:phosphotransferase system enzyme I (PtsI)